MPRLGAQIKPREAPICARVSCGRGLRLRRRLAGRHDHAPGAVERALAQLEAEQAVALERAGQRQFAGLAAPRSRSGHNRARRRAGSPRHGRAPWPPPAPGRISAAPMPSLRHDGSTASGPSTSAGVPPALTCHNRTVPTSRPLRTAEKARPSAGARPSRRRWQVRGWRLAPKQASSSASRAATSEARSARIANGAASAGRATGSSASSHGTSVPASRRQQAAGSVVSKFGSVKGWEPAHRLPVIQSLEERPVRCGRSAAAGSR